MCGSMVFYRVKKVNGKYYLYKEWYDPETKKRHSKSLGNCEEIERILINMMWCGRRDLNPGSPAWKAGVLIQARRRPPVSLFPSLFLVWSVLIKFYF